MSTSEDIAAKSPDGTVASSNRTKRGRETRLKLISAARSVFEEMGFIDARVADIVQLAGMSQGSFYGYWPSKEDAFLEIVRQLDKDLSTSFHVRSVVESPYERIKRGNQQYLDIYRANAKLIACWEQVCTFNRTFLEIRLESRTRAVSRLAASIKQMQETGLADPMLDHVCAAKALASMVGHFAYMWLCLGEYETEERSVDTLTRLWAQAIGLRPAGYKNSLT